MKTPPIDGTDKISPFPNVVTVFQGWPCTRGLEDYAAEIPSAPKSEPQIGDKMPAGHKQSQRIYAGISKTTH